MPSTTKNTKQLSSLELYEFFNTIAEMFAVGVRIDEIVYMLVGSSEGALKVAARRVHRHLLAGTPLSEAMQDAGMFPARTLQIVQAGENTGRLEETLRTLALDYGEEARLITKLRTSVSYPCILLCALTVILGFTVAAILPVFMRVYESMAGGLANSSFLVTQVGIVIGWVALAITLALALCSLAALQLNRSASGREKLFAILAKLPFTHRAVYTLSLSRFTSALAVYTASGSNIDNAVREAAKTITDKNLRKRIDSAYASMVNPEMPAGLVEAFTKNAVFDAAHLRALSFGMHAGRIDAVLGETAESLFSEAIQEIDSSIEKIEPALAGFVAVAVGATLIAVMLPLIGMMLSVG